jgi:hypothetical protein
MTAPLALSAVLLHGCLLSAVRTGTLLLLSSAHLPSNQLHKKDIGRIWHRMDRMDEEEKEEEEKEEKEEKEKDRKF